MKTRILYPVAAVAAAFLLACSAGEGKPQPVGDGNSVATEAAKQPAKTYYQPVAADFTLPVTILSQDCFGKAGCLIDYRVELKFSGAGELDPSKTYEITFEVRGLDNKKIETLTVTGKDYRVDDKISGSTPTDKVNVTAVVTSLRER